MTSCEVEAKWNQLAHDMAAQMNEDSNMAWRTKFRPLSERRCDIAVFMITRFSLAHSMCSLYILVQLVNPQAYQKNVTEDWKHIGNLRSTMYSKPITSGN